MSKLVFLRVALLAVLLAGCTLAAEPPTAPPATVGAAAAPAEAPAAATEVTPAPEQDGPITISQAISGRDRARIEPLAAAFEAANPGIRIRFVDLNELTPPGDGTLATVNDVLGYARTVLSAVDVAASYLLPDAALRGYVADLRPLIEADAAFDPDDFVAGALAPITPDEAIYMLPRAVQFPLRVYNRELWAAAGLPPPTPDWTLERYTDAIAQLARPGPADIETYGLVEWFSDHALLHELAQAGIDYSAPGRIDQPAVEEALGRLAERLKRGEFLVSRPEQGVAHWDLMQKIVSTGRGAIFEIDLYDPNLPGARRFETGILAPPPRPGSPYGTVSGYILSAGSRHPEAAWRWMTFLSRQDIRGTIDDPFDSRLVVPARRSVAARVGFWENLTHEERGVLEGALRMRADGATVPDFALQDWLRYVREAGDAALLGTHTPRQALTAAQARIERWRLDQQALLRPDPSEPPLSVAAPPPAPQAADTAVQINFGTTRYSEARVRKAADAFNLAQQDVFVTIRPSYNAGALTTVLAGNDCFTFPAPPQPDDVGFLRDLRPFIDADPALNIAAFPATALGLFEQQGRLYGLPDEVSLPTLGYDRAAFDAARLAYPTAVLKPADLLALALRLTSGSGRGRRYGYAAPGDMLQDLGFFLARFDANPLRGEGAAAVPAFTDAHLVEALRFYVQLLRQASPHTRLAGYSLRVDDDPTGDLFRAGRVALWLNLTRRPAPPAPGAATVPTAAPAPLDAAPLRPDELLATGLYITAETPNAAACWSWIKALGATPIAPSAGGLAPLRMSAWGADEQAAGDPAGDLAEQMRAVLGQPGAHPGIGGTGVALEPFWFYRAVDRALQGQELERELADAQALTEQWLACVRGGGQPGSCARQADPQYAGLLP